VKTGVMARIWFCATMRVGKGSEIGANYLADPIVDCKEGETQFPAPTSCGIRMYNLSWYVLGEPVPGGQ
jgi:hypothetical protein